MRGGDAGLAPRGTLTIRGERKGEKEVKEEDYYFAERWSGAFEREVPLPHGVDPEKIKATFKNGKTRADPLTFLAPWRFILRRR